MLYSYLLFLKVSKTNTPINSLSFNSIFLNNFNEKIWKQTKKIIPRWANPRFSDQTTLPQQMDTLQTKDFCPKIVEAKEIGSN